MGLTTFVNYSNKALQAYKVGALLPGRLSQEYKFNNHGSVTISTITTVPYGNYTRSGVSRYGTPAELQDTSQTLTCTQDKAFAVTIDKGNAKDQNYLKTAGKAVALQIKEQGIPMVDTYGFSQLVANAGHTNTNASALTKATVIKAVLDAGEYMDENEVPQEGRTLFVCPATYNLIKQAPEWVGVEALGKKALGAGVVGEIDGVTVVKVPSTRLGSKVNFILVHRDAGCLPIKIEETRIHQDPPGINGALIEGRQYYDCFVFTARANGVYVDMNP